MQFSYNVKLTCMFPGYDVYKCSRCEYEEVENFVQAEGHDLQFWYYQNADCVNQGGDWYFCKNCGTRFYETAQPHTGSSPCICGWYGDPPAAGYILTRPAPKKKKGME